MQSERITSPGWCVSVTAAPLSAGGSDLAAAKVLSYKLWWHQWHPDTPCRVTAPVPLHSTCISFLFNQSGGTSWKCSNHIGSMRVFICYIFLGLTMRLLNTTSDLCSQISLLYLTDNPECLFWLWGATVPHITLCSSNDLCPCANWWSRSETLHLTVAH